MIPRSSRSFRISSDRLGMSRVISSAPSLVSRASTSCSSMWIDVEHVVAHQALGQDDGVLEVVALPRHEGDEQVLAQGQLALVGGGAVGQHVAQGDGVALVDEGLLVDAGVLVGAAELGQPVDLAAQVRPSRSVWPSSYWTVMWSPVTSTTSPSPSARTTSPASRAARASTPVPM